jgi:hypothetical protein
VRESLRRVLWAFGFAGLGIFVATLCARDGNPADP